MRPSTTASPVIGEKERDYKENYNLEQSQVTEEGGQEKG